MICFVRDLRIRDWNDELVRGLDLEGFRDLRLQELHRPY
jgi:hypothetical protein